MDITIKLFINRMSFDCEARRVTDEAAERIHIGQPNSASACLRSVDNPDLLGNKAFTAWCMLSAEACDLVGEDMPYSSQLERTATYLAKRGTVEE